MSGRILFTVFSWLLIHLSCANFLYSQEYSWKYYSVADGLPQTQVYHVFQDVHGFIWVGTKGGLSRFDGIEFQNFTISQGLDFDFIYNIACTRQGRIYASSKRGLNYYESGKIHRINLNVSSFGDEWYIQKNGTIWGLNGVDKSIRCHDSDGNLKDHPFLDILNQKENARIYQILYNKTTNHLLVNLKNDNSYLIRDADIVEIPRDDRLIYYLQGDDGTIFGRSNDSLYVFEMGKNTPLVNISELDINRIRSKNDIYFADLKTRSTLIHFNGVDFEKFHHSFNMVLDVLVDDENNLWVGTESGLWRLQNRGFQNYLADNKKNFYTWTVLPDNHGNYWFGSFLNGLKKFDGQRFYDINMSQFFSHGGSQYFYSGGLLNPNGEILFSTSQGILKLCNDQFTWSYQNERKDEAILFIYFDTLSGHYFATGAYNGLIELNQQGHVTVHDDRPPRAHTDLETSMLRDKFGRIWLSGKIGISIKDNGQWRNLPDQQDSIPIGAISMLMDYKDNIWLGSNDGLYHYDYQKLRKVADRFFNQQIGVLNITDQNELLIGSIKGIGLLDLETFYDTGIQKVRYFDSNNGFMGTECKHNSSYKDRNGHIWICTSDRVVKVSPLDLKSNPNPPRVYIRSISAPSASMEWEPVLNIYDTGLVHTLAANHDDIRINYHAISHTAPMGVQYQTMLKGYDSEWSAASPERYRTYTNLPPGGYTFMVKAANIDGIWAKQPTGISIEILPEWHERMSVKIGGILAAVVSASFFGFLYSEQMRRKKLLAEENAKKMTQLQINSMKRLIDPHFTFNAINSIAAMVYKENREEAYTYFTKFSKLIRSVFDASDETTRTIKEEMAFIEDYLGIEKMRFKERFNYEIEIAPQVNYDWKIPKMMVQIYVENAIKHGLIARDSGGMIEVKLNTDANFLIITVRDNGIGRGSEAQNRTNPDSLGRGTSIMREYFNLLNKYNDEKIISETIDLRDADGNPAGTEVQVFIPLKFKYNL